VELQPFNVRVSCIIPAAASTGFQKSADIGEVNNQLSPQSIADTALYIASLPANAVVQDVTVWGIDQVVNPL
jgi:NADP-dependent 3-hydroxy acid dehydrogenase YdfG